MKGYLLDTNVLSEVIRKRPAAQVLTRLGTKPPSSLLTSCVCLMELRFGAARLPRGRALWERIQREILARVTVLPIGASEATVAGDLLAKLQRLGTPIGVEDVLIAATAMTNDLTVVTRNVKHLARVEGLVVECWWD
jgi:predicted nucleic acid-binding protein